MDQSIDVLLICYSVIVDVTSVAEERARKSLHFAVVLFGLRCFTLKPGDQQNTFVTKSSIIFTLDKKVNQINPSWEYNTKRSLVTLAELHFHCC